MTFEEFEKNVQNWAEVRGIYAHSTACAQLLKGVSELGELADAEIQNEHDKKLDAAGDFLVCLVNYVTMSDFTMEEAMDMAWNQIKNRTGHMVDGGAFVKDE